MTRRAFSKSHRLASVLLVAFGLGEPGNAIASELEACLPTSATCWYVVMGKMEPGKRELMLADARTVETRDGLKRTQMVHVFESGDIAAIALALDIRCKPLQVRQTSARGFGRKGETVKQDQVSPWIPADRSPLGRAAVLACDPSAKTDPQKHAFLPVGNIYRPRDLADIIAIGMFGQSPSGLDEK